MQGEPPLVTLIGQTPLVIEACSGTYVEEGATATDDCDGALPVIIGGDTVDVGTPGIYLVTYSATDSSGQTTIETRSVTVQDTVAPVFTHVPDDLTLACGPGNQAAIDAWLAEATATDACGIAVVTPSLSGIEACYSGSTLVTWTATDSHGLTAVATATLTIPPDTQLSGVALAESELQLTLPANGSHSASATVIHNGDCPTVIRAAEIAAGFGCPPITVASPALPATLCPGASLELALQIDTVGALEGVYSAVLNVLGQDGGSRSLPIRLTISGKLLPDITAHHGGAGVSITPDTSPVFPSSGEGFTIHATLKNLGTAPAGPFTVKFFEGANLLGTAAVPGLGLGQTTTAPFPVPAGFPDGWYLVRAEVVPPAEGELRLQNNFDSALLQVGTPQVASAYVRITGSVTPDCGLTASTLNLHAEYVLVTGDSTVTHPMQGAYVTATIAGTTHHVEGEHTDVDGNLTATMGLPAAGSYSVALEVTDFSITGTETLGLLVPAAPSCVQGGTPAATGGADPGFPMEVLDLYLCSGDVIFRAAEGSGPLDLPATPGAPVRICTTVHYYTSTGQELNEQPVHFIARRQVAGALQETFIGTALAHFAGGGTAEVCVPWVVPADGTYSILVTVSPNVSQSTLNDSATRAFVVAGPPGPGTVLRVTAEGAGCGGSGQWVSGRATYTDILALPLPVICGQVSVTAYDSADAVVGSRGVFKTDSAGHFYFRPYIDLPVGINRMVVAVTDGTLTGTAEFTIACASPNAPAPGTPPLAQGDLYVFAEHLAFLGQDCLSAMNRNPLPGELISANADIHYWDNHSGLPLSAVPVHVNVLVPSGGSLQTVPIGSTTVNFDSGGGSEIVCLPWAPAVAGPQILQVVINHDATYSFPFAEYAGNNAATKLIYVGELDCLLTAEPVQEQVQVGGSAVFTITGETLGTRRPTLQLSLVADSALPPPGVAFALGAGEITLPGETTLTLTTTAATPPGSYTFNLVGTGDNCSAVARVRLVVLDTTPPFLTCPVPPTPLTADAACVALAPDLTAGALVSDNRTPPEDIVVTQAPAVGEPLGLGTHPFTLTAMDAAGNAASCTVEVTVADETPPDLACPGPVSLEADGAGQALLPDLAVLATATDCNGPVITTQVPLAGTPLPAGSHSVTVTASDQAGASASCTVEVTVVDPGNPPDNTPEGTDIVVDPVPAVSVTFDEVTVRGTTTVTLSEDGLELPAGFRLGSPSVYYEISTTATYAGSILVCINYSGVSYLDESGLRLLHHNGGEWEDVTTSLDPENSVICGVVLSLSPFVVVEPENLPPEVSILGPAFGHVSPVNQGISFAGSFTDDGPAGSHTAQWIFRSSTLPPISIPGTVSGFSVADTFQFPEVGVYSVKLMVTDAQGASAEATRVLNDLPASVVIYDPSGGFVLGTGWIWSPPGALYPGLEEFASTEGVVTFGFVCRYRWGASVPTGQTLFRFRAGRLDFLGTAYQWLLVAGARAQFTGRGTINQQGDYGFLLTAVDGHLQGGGGADRLRIKIWDVASGLIVFDNQALSDENAPLDDSTVLRGGGIVIYR